MDGIGKIDLIEEQFEPWNMWQVYYRNLYKVQLTVLTSRNGISHAVHHITVQYSAVQNLFCFFFVYLSRTFSTTSLSTRHGSLPLWCSESWMNAFKTTEFCYFLDFAAGTLFFWSGGFCSSHISKKVERIRNFQLPPRQRWFCWKNICLRFSTKYTMTHSKADTMPPLDHCSFLVFDTFLIFHFTIDTARVVRWLHQKQNHYLLCPLATNGFGSWKREDLLLPVQNTSAMGADAQRMWIDH